MRYLYRLKYYIAKKIHDFIAKRIIKNLLVSIKSPKDETEARFLMAGDTLSLFNKNVNKPFIDLKVINTKSNPIEIEIIINPFKFKDYNKMEDTNGKK